jgi:hypothetical protein
LLDLGDAVLDQAVGSGQGRWRRWADHGGTRRADSAAAVGPAVDAGAGDSLKSRGLVCAGKHRDTEALFGFVMANQAAFSVQMMCRLLGVSTSGFYVWEDRPMSPRDRYDVYLTAKIHAIHRRSNGAYGSPMIHAELSDDHGIRVGCKRVARLMRAAHLQGVWPHRFVITTVRDEAAKQPIDLVDRGFYAEYPDRLWVADITYGTPRRCRSPPHGGNNA